VSVTGAIVDVALADARLGTGVIVIVRDGTLVAVASCIVSVGEFPQAAKTMAESTQIYRHTDNFEIIVLSLCQIVGMNTCKKNTKRWTPGSFFLL
jgi:hypothetical protein